MNRETGIYEVTTTAGEAVRAFVPNPLPPLPPLEMDGARQRVLERAQLACGRLDGLAELLPDRNQFLYAYVRREAVLSSQIEGTKSSLSDLLLFELAEAPGVPLDDVVEVSNYVAALDHGMSLLRSGLPISGRLLREVHDKLLARGRGSDKRPGEFRTSQNWIGGNRPGKAHFVPPPPSKVADCMGALERFINADETLPVLIKAALAHVQFETIHPFLDGNGRVGRLLIVLMFQEQKILHQPLLYLSLYFKQNRSEYYRLLDAVRRDGDWEGWIDFFLDGVINTAGAAVDTAQRLLKIFSEDEKLVAFAAKGSGIIRTYGALRERPVATIADLASRAGLSFPTASKSVAALVRAGIVRELTGGRRDRVFAYGQYLDVLNEGTEPL